MPKSRPPHPAEFRQQMIELARAAKTPAQLSLGNMTPQCRDGRVTR